MSQSLEVVSTSVMMFDIVHRLNCVPSCSVHCHPHHHLPYDPSVGYFPWGMIDGKRYPRKRPSSANGMIVSELTLDGMCRLARMIRSNKREGMFSSVTADCARQCETCPGGRYRDTFEPCRRAFGLTTRVLSLPSGQFPDESWFDLLAEEECREGVYSHSFEHCPGRGDAAYLNDFSYAFKIETIHDPVLGFWDTPMDVMYLCLTAFVLPPDNPDPGGCTQRSEATGCLLG